jgi:hypothetical protein
VDAVDIAELNDAYRQLVASNAPIHDWGIFEVRVFDAFIAQHETVVAIQKAWLERSTVAPDPALDVASARAAELITLRKQIEVQLLAVRARRAVGAAFGGVSYKVR